MTYEMKKIKFKGKDYVQVVERLKFFREKYEHGTIKTEIKIEGQYIIAKAEIFIDNVLISTGNALKPLLGEFELEKCETRAIGRALAVAGIGLDAGIASFDEARDFFEKQDGLKPIDSNNYSVDYNKQFLTGETTYEK